MSIFKAIILGIVQGLTEFLPVSSSGHLVIFGEILGMNDLEQSHLLFDTLLHLGTLISICLVYGKDVYNLIKEFFKMLGDIVKGYVDINSSPYRRLILLIITASIPAGIVGVFFKDQIEVMFTSVRIAGFMLLITGLLLVLSSKLIVGSKDEMKCKYSNAFTVGIFQAFAIIPGISRSGSTIVSGLLNGFTKEFAVKFSFLMSIPAILGAIILQIPDVVKEGVDAALVLPYTIGTIAAAIVGFIAIKFLIKLLKKGKLHIFAYYCWAVGIISIIYSLFK